MDDYMAGRTDVELRFAFQDFREDLLVRFMQDNNGVRHLSLVSVEISKGGLVAFFDALAGNQVIQVLELYLIKFDSDVIDALALFLKRNRSIKELGLSANNLLDRGFSMICDALTDNTTLQLLKLADSGLGEQGCRSLGRFLEKNASLMELYLPRNPIGNAGAMALAAGLEHNSTLERLNLFRGDIEYDGGVAIANVLTKNTGLKELKLNHNNLGAVELSVLANSLKHNRSLESLDISENKFEPNDDAMLAFQDVLATSNVSLQELQINWNGNPEAIDILLLRNKEQIPATVRRAALLLIGIRRSTNFEGMGVFGVCPKDVVRLIAMAVWATRKDPVWIQALKYN
jgi:Ran GTPase-activating protein (RanGAP) involved in mRNA processing and transport